MTETADHLGASFRLAPGGAYAVFSFHAFRSEAKGEESFAFLLENYLEQPARRVVFDVRNALWPDDMQALESRFANHAARLPRSRVAGLCMDPGDPVMQAALTQFAKAGHTVILTASEAEAVAWVEAGAEAADRRDGAGRGVLGALRRILAPHRGA